MKLILAVIQPTKLEATQQALARIGVTRLSVSDAMGFARQRGQTESYRGSEYKTNLLRKVQLEIAVNDDFVERTIECLQQSARTSTEGTIGDGKILVLRFSCYPWTKPYKSAMCSAAQVLYNTL